MKSLRNELAGEARLKGAVRSTFPPSLLWEGDMDQEPDGAPPRRPRGHDRFPINGQATLRREGGNNYRVRVYDISEAGCKVEIVERPAVAEGVWVKFDGLEALHARVSWVAPPVAGLRFERPIHPAVFEMLIKRLSRGAGAS